MSTIIGLKELREHTTEITERVAHGESFVVIKRSKPIFNLTPIVVDSQAHQDEVADWTKKFINRYRPAFEALADK